MITTQQWIQWAKEDIIDWEKQIRELKSTLSTAEYAQIESDLIEIRNNYKKRYRQLLMTEQHKLLLRIHDATDKLDARWETLTEDQKVAWLNRYEQLCNEYVGKFGEYEYETREREPHLIATLQGV